MATQEEKKQLFQEQNEDKDRTSLLIPQNPLDMSGDLSAEILQINNANNPEVTQNSYVDLLGSVVDLQLSVEKSQMTSYENRKMSPKSDLTANYIKLHSAENDTNNEYESQKPDIKNDAIEITNQKIGVQAKIYPLLDVDEHAKEVDIKENGKTNWSLSFGSFKTRPTTTEDVTKAETPAFRNKEIAEQEPFYYQHMFHIKNLRKIDGLSKLQSYKIQSQDKDMINAQMMPFVCNGILFTILFNYERASRRKEFEGRTYLRILKHKSDTNMDNTPEIVFEKYLQNNNCGEKVVKNAFPGVFNVNRLYFCVVKNNLDESTAKYEVWCYDFENMKDRIVVSKEQPWPKAFQGSNLIPQLGLLSVYVPINENAQFDKTIVLTEEQFLKNTHVRYNFRSTEPLKETGFYRGLLQAFRLSEFDKMLYDVRWNEETLNIKEETPLKEFVQFGKYYLCNYDKYKLQAEYMDIIPDGGSIKLSKKQGASMIDAETKERMERYFQKNYSLHALVMNKETRNQEITDWKVTHGETQIPLYLKLAEDCAFDFGAKGRIIDTMNILFDTINEQVYIMASSGSFFEMKIVKMSEEFTRHKLVRPVRDLQETSQCQQSIENEAFKLDLKASQSGGIFFQIQTFNDEIIMRETIMTQFFLTIFQQSVVAWSTSCQEKLDQPGFKQQSFMLAQFGTSKQNSIFTEFRLVWKVDQFIKGTRLFNETQITGMDFVKFMMKSADIITLQISSVHIVCMKDPIPGKIYFKSTLDESNGRIKGAEWWSSDKPDRIVVKFDDIIGRNHNFKSDITESNYTVYKNEKGEQVALHVVSTLAQAMRAQFKSPWQRSLHVFESIYDTNPLLMEAAYQKVYGIQAWNAYLLKRKMTDSVSMNPNDRQQLLKQQVRILMNMVPISFSELILDSKNIDIFNPIEQMNGQCYCDFYLKASELVKRKIKNAQNEETRPGIIKIFCKDDPKLLNNLSYFGFVQKPNEPISGFYGGNPLQRCFQGEEIRTTTAQLLLDHIFSGEITFEIRQILAVTMPYILECELEPFPFKKFGQFFLNRPNNGLSFFQHITDKKVESFSHKSQNLTYVDSRNYSSDANLIFKNHLACLRLKKEQSQIDAAMKTIPVQHCILDFQSVRLFYKIRQMRQGKPISKTYLPSLGDWMQEISDKFGSQIENHTVLMKVSDCLFERTSIFYNTLLFLWGFGYILPLGIQIVYSGEQYGNVTIGCNISCLTIIILFHIIENIQMVQVSLKDYWTSRSNIQQQIYFILYYVYFAFRMESHNDSILPLNHKKIGIMSNNAECAKGIQNCTYKRYVIDPTEEYSLNEQVTISIVHWFLIVYGMLQALEIIKVQQKIGQTVKLVEAVLVDVAAFVLFFSTWVLIFSFLHRIIGREVDRGDKNYTYMTDTFRYFLHVWIYSTGGGSTAAPDYDIWFKIGKDKPNLYLSQIMIYFMHLTNMANQLFLNKIMLSFLIAMVGKALARQNANMTINSYSARTELNSQCSVVMNMFGLLSDETELVVLSANYMKPVVPNETAELTKKCAVMDMGMRKIQEEMKIHIEKQDKLAQNHKAEMQELKTMMMQLLNKK